MSMTDTLPDGLMKSGEVFTPTTTECKNASKVTSVKYESEILQVVNSDACNTNK